MSIRQRMMMIMVGISMAAVILTVTAITTYLIYDIRASKLQDLAVAAVLTGDRNRAAVLFQDQENVEKNLEIFRHHQAMRLVCVYAADNTLFASYENNQSSSLQCPETATLVPSGIEGMLTSLQPISSKTSASGKVFVVSDTSEIDSYIEKILQVSISVALLALPLILLLAGWLQRSISGPLHRLATTVKSITEHHDYSLQATPSKTTETNMLATAFNAMLTEVQKRDRKLVEANETLEQKVAERTQELVEAIRKAEQASAAKSEFLRNISHEFRTPLHALISFSAYGIRESGSADPAQLKQYFTIIEKSAERLTRLVNEVLDLSSMEEGALQLNTQLADLRDPVKRAVESIEPLMFDKNIRFTCSLPESPLTIPLHVDKIVQVVTNLLGNAIKFTPEGNAISLEIDEEAQTDSAILRVRDEGVGIPEEEMESIFEFFQQSSRTNTGAGGTGLGLAICKGIVRAHGGKIRAENNPDGVGACITVTLPRSERAQQKPHHEPSGSSGYDHAAA